MQNFHTFLFKKMLESGEKTGLKWGKIGFLRWKCQSKLIAWKINFSKSTAVFIGNLSNFNFGSEGRRILLRRNSYQIGKALNWTSLPPHPNRIPVNNSIQLARLWIALLTLWTQKNLFLLGRIERKWRYPQHWWINELPHN